MSNRMKVTVLVDIAEIPQDDPAFIREPEEPTAEYHVVGTLRGLGHEVSVLGAAGDVASLAASLQDQRPDIVFNLTEHLEGDRRMDKNIAAILEMLGIPFTGAGATGLMLCRDKGLCKQLLSLHKIRVPGFVSVPCGRVVRIPRNLNYPLVVKPAFEDGSEGISNASVVSDEASFIERVHFVHDRWHQAAIAEEYIEGRELYVSIIGNRRLMALPPRECLYDFAGPDGPRLLTYRVKWDMKYRDKWKIKFGFARLDGLIEKKIHRICKRVYRLLHLKDYARIDLRLTPDGKVVILEANPNPDIVYGEDFSESAYQAGIDYEDLIARILRMAMARYKGV